MVLINKMLQPINDVINYKIDAIPIFSSMLDKSAYIIIYSVVQGSVDELFQLMEDSGVDDTRIVFPFEKSIG